MPWVLIARPDLKLPNKGKYPAVIADLKDLNWGVYGRGSDGELFMRVMAGDAKLNVDKDMTWIAVGGPPTGLPALKAKRIDVYFTISPAPNVATVLGYAQTVLDLRKGEGPGDFKGIHYNGTVTLRKTAQSRPKAVDAIVAARLRHQRVVLEGNARGKKVDLACSRRSRILLQLVRPHHHQIALAHQSASDLPLRLINSVVDIEDQLFAATHGEERGRESATVNGPLGEDHLVVADPGKRACVSQRLFHPDPRDLGDRRLVPEPPGEVSAKDPGRLVQNAPMPELFELLGQVEDAVPRARQPPPAFGEEVESMCQSVPRVPIRSILPPSIIPLTPRDPAELFSHALGCVAGLGESRSAAAAPRELRAGAKVVAGPCTKGIWGWKRYGDGDSSGQPILRLAASPHLPHLPISSVHRTAAATDPQNRLASIP